MKTHMFSRYFAEAIPAVAFNIVYFLLVEDFTLSRWIGWACLHAAYLVFVMTLRGVGSMDRKAVFGYPKVGIAFALLLATAVAFAAIFVIKPKSEKWPVVIEVLSTAGLGVLYFSLDVAEGATRSHEEKLRRHYAFVATTAQIIDEARRNVSDASLKKSVERAYDAVRNGNVMSVQESADIEAEIVAMSRRLMEVVGGVWEKEEILSLSAKIEVAMRTRETIVRNSRLGR